MNRNISIGILVAVVVWFLYDTYNGYLEATGGATSSTIAVVTTSSPELAKRLTNKKMTPSLVTDIKIPSLFFNGEETKHNDYTPETRVEKILIDGILWREERSDRIAIIDGTPMKIGGRLSSGIIIDIDKTGIYVGRSKINNTYYELRED